MLVKWSQWPSGSLGWGLRWFGRCLGGGLVESRGDRSVPPAPPRPGDPRPCRGLVRELVDIDGAEILRNGDIVAQSFYFEDLATHWRAALSQDARLTEQKQKCCVSLSYFPSAAIDLSESETIVRQTVDWHGN